MSLRTVECLVVITVQHEGTYVKVVYDSDLAELVRTRIEKYPQSVYGDLLECQKYEEVEDISDVSHLLNPNHDIPVYHGLVVPHL